MDERALLAWFAFVCGACGGSSGAAIFGNGDASDPQNDAATPADASAVGDAGAGGDTGRDAGALGDGSFAIDGSTSPDGGADASCVPAPSSPTVTSVKDAPYGATGDGVTDDTAAIQKALNAVAGTGGTLFVPDGTYMIDVTAIPYAGAHGLEITGSMTLRLSSGAVLKAIPTDVDTYAILAIIQAKTVNVVGGTLEGERDGHTGTGGEWGMGLRLDGSERVVVEGVTAKKCWGDGFYLVGAAKSSTFCGVVADSNRRQGMSIVDASGVVIRNSTFRNTSGTAPENGIDIEPDQGEAVTDVLIQGSTFENNAGGAFQTGVPVANTGQATVSGVVFDGNTVKNNGVGSLMNAYEPAVRVSNTDGTKVTNNTLDDNTGQGITLTQKATHTIVTGNTVRGTKLVTGSEYWTGIGILIDDAAGSNVTQNTVTGNAGHGIWQVVADPSVTVSGNVVSGNALTP